MPIFIREPLSTNSVASISPLKSNLEDMISTCEALDKKLAVIVEDGEEFGGISEETFCYTAPEILQLLHKISRIAGLCTRDIHLNDEALVGDEGSLSLVVYNFISEHCRTMSRLTSQKDTLKSSGSFFEGLAQSLIRQQFILNAFRDALNSKNLVVRERSAPDWVELTETMRTVRFILHAFQMQDLVQPIECACFARVTCYLHLFDLRRQHETAQISMEDSVASRNVCGNGQQFRTSDMSTQGKSVNHGGAISREERVEHILVDRKMVPGILTEEDLDGQTAHTASENIDIPITPVLDASLITKEFDPLRFEAAASLQLLPHNARYAFPTSHNLISSPYNEPAHLLNLLTLSTQHVLFAKALTVLKPIVPDYATAEYSVMLNWDFVLETLRSLSEEVGYSWKEQSFYAVIFRSKLKPTADMDQLYLLDQMSHAEAAASGGLLKYWFGKGNGENRNLATCLWRNREDARLGGLGPWHKKARAAAREMYESITFEIRRFVVLDGAEGCRVEEWTD
ncbi:hypothetical protein EJ08DRAFT_654998 [Tothia fuscella]|uniref:Uncharacterized protein n=1 Tax=Tothia fuscella TaxID=1048955 RepID=A0A9P4P4P2_9PEZI|nr:hypothetical protein EJ08DRAFT_654998 [Tothia fuscella]